MPPTLGTSSRFLELRKYNYFITVRWKIKNRRNAYAHLRHTKD